MNEVKLGPQYAGPLVHQDQRLPIQYTADKALICVLSLFDESITFYHSSPALHPTPIAVVQKKKKTTGTLFVLLGPDSLRLLVENMTYGHNQRLHFPMSAFVLSCRALTSNILPIIILAGGLT